MEVWGCIIAGIAMGLAIMAFIAWLVIRLSEWKVEREWKKAEEANWIRHMYDMQSQDCEMICQSTCETTAQVYAKPNTPCDTPCQSSCQATAEIEG